MGRKRRFKWLNTKLQIIRVVRAYFDILIDDRLLDEASLPPIDRTGTNQYLQGTRSIALKYDICAAKKEPCQQEQILQRAWLRNSKWSGKPKGMKIDLMNMGQYTKDGKVDLNRNVIQGTSLKKLHVCRARTTIQQSLHARRPRYCMVLTVYSLYTEGLDKGT